MTLLVLTVMYALSAMWPAFVPFWRDATT